MLMALRPWTWTAGVVPVLLIATLIHKRNGELLDKTGVIKALVAISSAQSVANLVNSVVDYNSGVDTFDTEGDRTIVDGLVSRRAAMGLGAGLLGLCLLTVVPAIMALKDSDAAWDLGVAFSVGLGLCVSYTCWPLRLKYRGLGDIVTFITCGPLLTQVASLLVTGRSQFWVMPYGIPVALLCEGILHANNMRDIHQDREAGITTLAMMIGFQRSRVFYMGLITSAYLVACGLAVLRYRGFVLTLLTLPLALSTIKACKPQTMRDLPTATAKLHLSFGITMILGLLLSP